MCLGDIAIINKFQCRNKAANFSKSQNNANIIIMNEFVKKKY